MLLERDLQERPPACRLQREWNPRCLGLGDEVVRGEGFMIGGGLRRLYLVPMVVLAVVNLRLGLAVGLGRLFLFLGLSKDLLVLIFKESI